METPDFGGISKNDPFLIKNRDHFWDPKTLQMSSDLIKNGPKNGSQNRSKMGHFWDPLYLPTTRNRVWDPFLDPFWDPFLDPLFTVLVNIEAEAPLRYPVPLRTPPKRGPKKGSFLGTPKYPVWSEIRDFWIFRSGFVKTDNFGQNRQKMTKKWRKITKNHPFFTYFSPILRFWAISPFRGKWLRTQKWPKMAKNGPKRGHFWPFLDLFWTLFGPLFWPLFGPPEIFKRAFMPFLENDQKNQNWNCPKMMKNTPKIMIFGVFN